MSPATERRRLPRTWFYAIVAIIAALVWLVQTYSYHIIFGTPGTIFSSIPANAPSVNWPDLAVKVMTDLNSVLTTLGTALLGAVGWLVVQERRRSGTRHQWSAFLAVLAGGISLYFGYVSHLNLLWLINNQNLNTYQLVYLFSSRFQFYSLLAGAFFFADYAFYHFTEEK